MDWLLLLLFVAQAAWFIFLTREVNRDLDEALRQEAETLKELNEAEAIALRQRVRLEQLSKGEF